MISHKRASPEDPGTIRTWRLSLLGFSALCLLLLLAGIVLAQSGSTYDLHWNVSGSAGGEATGTTYRVQYTLGQPSTVGVSTGSAYKVLQGFWQWASSPTAVKLKRFGAFPQGSSVRVRWETASEIDNLGFNVYRSNTRAGPKGKLNAALIPPKVPPGSPFGARYEYIDTYRLRPGRIYFYWLEDVDIYGHTTMHGPVKARMP